jgi:hypothetical protein
VFGLVLVFGLVVEFLAGHKGKKYSKLKKRKRLFEILVIAGVAGELLADGGIFLFGRQLQTIADRDIANTNLEAKQAGKAAAASYENAAVAKREAGQAKERAANTESNNAALLMRVEELRNQNLGLASKVIAAQPRRITPKQYTDFIEALRNKPKGPVRVIVGREDSETQTYAAQIRQMLDDAGYSTGTSNDITQWGESLCQSVKRS